MTDDSENYQRHYDKDHPATIILKPELTWRIPIILYRTKLSVSIPAQGFCNRAFLS